MRRLLLLLIVLALPASAQASTTVIPPEGAYPYQHWVDKAKVPTPDVRLRVIEATSGCSEGSACTREGSYTIRLDPRWITRRTFLHEVAHNFDYYNMDGPGRLAFERINRDTRPWRSSPNSPHERFAEGYSLCARRTRIRHRRTLGYLYSVSPREHRRVCELIQGYG